MSHTTVLNFIVDLLEPVGFYFTENTPFVITNTRAVHGVSLATNGIYLASYIDNIVTLWDIRSIDKSLSVYQTEKNINSLSWCATRFVFTFLVTKNR